MARVPSNRRAPGSLEPGQLYHVTNRGVDRCEIFHSDLDRVMFLSMVAEACQLYGAVCHAWCLMTTHWHCVIEDPRGMLSQVLHRFESAYVRYFNDSRARRRTGPLFEGRFRSELVDSVRYFEDACAYVLLNPVDTQSPMAATAEAYRWSSAKMLCSETTPAQAMLGLLEPMGGVEAILASLPPSKRTASVERRRRRLEALVSGEWLEGDHVLAGRSGDAYRQRLAGRAAQRAAKRAGTAPVVPLADATARVHPATLASRPAFAGFPLAEVEAEIREACERFVPPVLSTSVCLRDLTVYALHRFTSAPLAALAKGAGISRGVARRLIERLRGERTNMPERHGLLWSIEWSLRWQLGAAPYRS